MGISQFFHENRPAMCVIGLILGIPLSIISILSFLYTDGDTGLYQWGYELVGNWSYWIILPALAIAFIGGWYLYDFYKMLKEFRELIGIESKAKFIKNIDRIEELAWRLHPKYEKMVIEKKKKYKVR